MYNKKKGYWYKKPHNSIWIYIDNCKQCDEPFLAQKYNKGIFCSLSCNTTYRNKTNNPMNNLETRKKVSTTRIKGNHGWKQIGDKNPAWKGGVWKYNETERNILKKQPVYINWRKSVFERDSYTCHRCNQVGGELNAHHIYNWKEFPSLRYEEWNGFTMCVKCHRWIHSNKNIDKDFIGDI